MLEFPKIWAGTETAFDLLVAAMDLATEIIQTQAASGKNDPFQLPPLFSVVDGVGVVEVKGPLIPGTAGFMRLFGVTGYGDIQEGLMQAAQSKDAKSILIHYATGGGSVEGVDETSEFIAEVGKLKPILSYAGGNMQSAGYWLGSSGKRILASRTSLVGSIGAVVTHIERSRQLEKDGIGVNVVRSGKWKALVNSIEPLSKEGREFLEALVADTNELFEQRVAANLGVTRKTVHDQFGQGRDFFGVKAMEVGLVHGISNFQEAHAAAKILARA